MNEAEVLRVLRVHWVLPGPSGRRVDLASSSVLTGAAPARTAVVFVRLHKIAVSNGFRVGTYMAGCLLDVVVVMVVHLLKSSLSLVGGFPQPSVHLTRLFRFLRTLRRNLPQPELLLLGQFDGPFLDFPRLLLQFVARRLGRFLISE